MICQDPSDVKCASQSAAIPSVQGQLKQHEMFWLDELEPSSFVAGIVT